MARPVIGDFRGAENNKLREPPKTEAEPVASEKVEADEERDMLTPAEKYRELLKERNIALDEADAIYDAVLSKGYYEEYVRLRGNHRAVFRTRQYSDNLRLQTALEMGKPQLVLSQDELITRYNLAASLFEWDGKPLKHDTEADFDAVMSLIQKMPAPLYSVLARELSKFDAKMMAIFSEGAEQNF